MECGRCEAGKLAEYRVFSEIMNLNVCADCAAEARQLHLGIELLDTRQHDQHMRKAS